MALGPCREQKYSQATSEFPSELGKCPLYLPSDTYCKTIVFSRSRTVFLKCVTEEEYLSSAAWSVPPQTSPRSLPVVGTFPPVALTSADCGGVTGGGRWRSWIVHQRPDFTGKAMLLEKGWCLVPACPLAEVTGAIWDFLHTGNLTVPEKNRLESRPRGLLLWSVSSPQQKVLGHAASKLWRVHVSIGGLYPNPFGFFF